ncbi:MAG: ATP-binding protein [bacterium]|nr:ATP-binding protein [bacterium]
MSYTHTTGFTPNASQYQELKDTQEQLAAANALAWLGIVGAIWKHDVISDTGCRIPEEIRSQLFKKQVSGAIGSGVGLLLVKTILQRYGGNIELKSSGPEGTTFVLWLPTKKSKEL